MRRRAIIVLIFPRCDLCLPRGVSRSRGELAPACLECRPAEQVFH